MSSNLIKIIVAAIIGISLGLVYGWVIEPVEFTNLTPSLLREDYRADYVLMVAEAYHGEINANVAARRLAVLSSEAPVVIVTSTIEYAQINGFTQNEINSLQELLKLGINPYPAAKYNRPFFPIPVHGYIRDLVILMLNQNKTVGLYRAGKLNNYF